MKHRLPVKTIKLKKSTRPVLYTSLLVFVLTAGTLFGLALQLHFGSGKLTLLLASIFMMMISLFTLIAIIKIVRQGYIGMFISVEGINDISRGYSYGMVQWKDVNKIVTMADLEKPKSRYVVLYVNNPQEYIDREPADHKKRSLTLKFHHYGSPICFSNRALDCTFEELENTLCEYYANSKDVSAGKTLKQNR